MSKESSYQAKNKNPNLGHIYQKEDLESHNTMSCTVRIKMISI